MTSKDEIGRSIRFYKVEFIADGEATEPTKLFEYINSIEYPDRYRELTDGRSWTMEFSGKIERSITKILMGTKRVAGLPQIEEDGKRKPLTLSGRQGLFEPTHFAVFSNKVLAMEYNKYGPKTGAFKDYLEKKAPDYVDEVIINAIPRGDLNNTLHNIGEIKLMDVGILTSRSEYLNKLDEGLASAFQELKNWEEVGTAELILRPKSDQEDQKNLEGILEKLGANKEDRELWDSIETFRVKARNSSTKRIELFDLLENLVKSVKNVKKDENGSRSVNSSSMFIAIREAFNENEEDIRKFVDMNGSD